MYSQNTESMNNPVQHHPLPNRKTRRHYSQMHTDLLLHQIEEGTRGVKTGYTQKMGKVASNTRKGYTQKIGKVASKTIKVYDNTHKGVQKVYRQDRLHKRVI